MRLWKSECSMAFIIHFIQAFLLWVVMVNQSRQVENYHLGFYDEEVVTKYEQSSIIAALNVKLKNLKVYLGSDRLVFLMFLYSHVPYHFPLDIWLIFFPVSVNHVYLYQRQVYHTGQGRYTSLLTAWLRWFQMSGSFIDAFLHSPCSPVMNHIHQRAVIKHMSYINPGQESI